MLVNALLLRSHGVKLTPAALREQAPLVGFLSFKESVYQGRDERGLWVCTLMPVLGDYGWSVELFDARVLRIEPRGILVGGVEDSWLRKKRTSYTQVLWAWPAGGVQNRHAPIPGEQQPARLIEELSAVI